MDLQSPARTIDARTKGATTEVFLNLFRAQHPPVTIGYLSTGTTYNSLNKLLEKMVTDWLYAKESLFLKRRRMCTLTTNVLHYLAEYHSWNPLKSISPLQINKRCTKLFFKTTFSAEVVFININYTPLVRHGKKKSQEETDYSSSF